MLSGLAPVLQVVAPVFACAALGFLWARTGKPFDRAGITALIASIGAPCLVFRSLVELPVDTGTLLEMAGATALSIGAFAVLGSLALRLLGLPSHTFLSPLVFGNAGNMGLAVCTFAFPGEVGSIGPGPGLALGAVFFAVASFLHFTLGVAMWTGRFSIGQLLGTPLTWAVILACVVIVTGLPVPGWILDTTELLGGLSIPLMLITLGVALSGLDLGRLPQTLLLSVLRLAMGASVGFGLAALLGLEGVARGVLIIECSMPAAVFNALFAEQFDRSPEQVASMVVASTLLSFLTLPLILAAVL